MGTNRTRKLRISKNRVPSNVTEEFISDLRCREFLSEELNKEEKRLASEFSKCKWDLEKWLKFREQKLKKAKTEK